MSKEETKGVTINPETAAILSEMLRTVLAEARKPADPTPAEAAAMESDRQMREQTAKLALDQMASKKAEQEACLHQRRDGTTPAVYVQDGNYMICQHCQKVIRPETELALFNRLFQLQSPAIF